MPTPYGDFINQLPTLFFLGVHVLAFGLAVHFASRAFDAGVRRLGWGFILYAIAEAVYMTYHLDWTVFLFAHTIAEVLDLGAFVLIFSALLQSLDATLRPRTEP